MLFQLRSGQTPAELAEEINGRSLFIASTNWCPAKVCRSFLQHADKCGADAVKVQTNPWMVSTSGLPPRQTILGYFDQIQDAAEIPLILWGHSIAPYPVEVVAELAKRPQIVGMKNDDDPFGYYYDTIRATKDEDFGVFSGGLMRNFIFGYPVGSPGYLCPIAPFLPKIALAFYDALVAGRTDEAWRIILQYEEPWLTTASGIGWLQSLKSAFHLYGLFPNNRVIEPGWSHNNEQYQQIRQCLERVFGPIERAQL